jgi:DNA adenine methylase
MEIDTRIAAPKVVPFLKWAGGKRWLVKRELNLFPEKFHTYIEPFLGSGTVFFHLNPKCSIISDINGDLINTYVALRDNYRKVEKYLKVHAGNHSKKYYYDVRAEKPRGKYCRAAQFIYLNRTCFNGLYRVNLKGQFNVPIGTKNNVLMDSDDFDQISSRLSGSEIRNLDFEEILSRASKDDFVFVDPPYTVKHDMNGFIKYNEKIFSWEDQERLRQAIDLAVDRGAKVLVLNAAHQSIKNLYKDYECVEYSRSSVLSGKPEFRGAVRELAVKCGYY